MRVTPSSLLLKVVQEIQKLGRYVPPQPENQAISHPVVREEHTVIVDSVRERWLLVWREPPKPICSLETADAFPFGGAPCFGFRYGEYGQLDLVRKRPGVPNNLLPLGPLYEEAPAGRGMAVLPHWPVLDGDYELSQTSPARFSALVRARRPVTVMHIADYDHDGRATEFPLQIGTLSGTEPTILVGISRRFPYLHAFGTVLHPKEPLVLRDSSQWDTVLHARRKVTLIQLHCGDHGGGEQWEFELRFDKEGIHATRIVYSCGPDFSEARGALKSREEF
jgi:hypothetical protein